MFVLLFLFFVGVVFHVCAAFAAVFNVCAALAVFVAVCAVVLLLLLLLLVFLLVRFFCCCFRFVAAAVWVFRSSTFENQSVPAFDLSLCLCCFSCFLLVLFFMFVLLLLLFLVLLLFLLFFFVQTHEQEASGTPAPPWTSVRRLRRESLLSSSRCGQTEPIHVGSTNVGSAITVQSRHNRGVCRQLCPAMEGQPIRDNFESATILHVHGLQIQVAHHYVGGHSGAGLTAHPGSSTLERKAPSCQHPARAQVARWWPKASMGRPHRQKRRARGSGSQRRRNKRVWNSWESNRTSGCVGTVDSATPAPLPL